MLLIEENSSEALVVSVIESRVDCGGCGAVAPHRVAEITGLDDTEVNRIIDDLVRDGRLFIHSKVSHTMHVTLTRSWS